MAEREQAGANNGFAGEPALRGIAPFLTLSAAISGQIDPRTGMLINIKIVDKVLRQSAVPMLRAYVYGTGRGARGADLLPRLFETLEPLLAPHRLESLQLALSPYLSLRVERPELNMVTLIERFEFSASHRLHSSALSDAENREVFGRCNNVNGHGHNYEVDVAITGTPDKSGALMPLYELQRLVNQHVIDRFDHKHLNVDCAEFAGMNPTVENIAQVIFDKLKQPLTTAQAKLAFVRVYETPKTFCQVSA